MAFPLCMLEAEPSFLEEYQTLLNDENLSSSKKETSRLTNSYLTMEEIRVVITFGKCLSTFHCSYLPISVHHRSKNNVLNILKAKTCFP